MTLELSFSAFYYYHNHHHYYHHISGTVSVQNCLATEIRFACEVIAKLFGFCVIRDSANLITTLGFARSYCGIHREPVVLGGEEGGEIGSMKRWKS